MAIEICMAKAKRRYKTGLVKSLRVSFICFRKNELIREKIVEDPSKAMAQASEEYEKFKEK